MNAKDLANELDRAISENMTDLVCVQDAATLLRKQADDIEYMQDQFDRAIEFLAKCNGWSKNK
jgi:hypothetical protein